MGKYKLVYIAPERFDSARFQQFVRSTPIDLLVIDEAHCISQWGHDFRPHYRTITRRLPNQTPQCSLTATHGAVQMTSQERWSFRRWRALWATSIARTFDYR
jgi:ATP-dependent DNA helicase RecQ